MKNISGNASRSLLSEVVCHNLSCLSAHDFNLEVGLIKGRIAPKKSRQLIWAALGLEGEDVVILTAKDARSSPLATCRQNDVVLLRDGDGFRFWSRMNVCVWFRRSHFSGECQGLP